MKLKPDYRSSVTSKDVIQIKNKSEMAKDMRISFNKKISKIKL